MPVIGDKVFIKISSDNEADKMWMSEKATHLEHNHSSNKK